MERYYDDFKVAKALLPNEDRIELINLMKYLISTINMDVDKDILIDSFIPSENDELKEEASIIIDQFKKDYEDTAKIDGIEKDDIKIRLLFIISVRSEELIEDLEEFILDLFPNEDYAFIRNAVDCMTQRNRIILESLEDDIDYMKEIIKNAKPVSSDRVELEGLFVSNEEFNNEQKVDDFESILDIIITYDGEDRIRLLEQNYKNLAYIKLLILSKMNNIQNKLLSFNIFNMDINYYNELKDTYNLLNSVFEDIKTLSITNNKTNESTVKNEEELDKVVFIPDSKGSTYICQDILSIIERKQEIKQEFNKIFNGYFLRTGRVKKLEKYDDLWEYYNKKSGVRVMFVKKGAYFFVSSFFFKKDQKSLRTTGIYEESIRRFEDNKDYLLDNLESIDFYFEQQDYIQELDNILNEDVVVKEKK